MRAADLAAADSRSGGRLLDSSLWREIAMRTLNDRAQLSWENMVDERFKHPPLVELIAEVRWGSGGGVAIGQPQTAAGLHLLTSGQYEEFFMRFGSKVGAHGYDLVERIVPPGFPAMAGQAIYRFRQKQQTSGTTLYQVGTGVFSANITPPYQSWKEFRPVVAKGLGVLLETRNDPEKGAPFSNVTLRYINAFTPEFTQGRSTAVFVREVLGFKVEPPGSVLREIAFDQEAKPHLQLTIPLASGQQLSMMLADGIVSGNQAVVMDITINTNKNIPATETAVMSELEGAHDIIHRVFVGTTEKLFSIMEPITGDET
jgi:uncharacterized protein (TIGR04255 family)